MKKVWILIEGTGWDGMGWDAVPDKKNEKFKLKA